ncbi:hypothetical protein K1719_033104 [Acacia pycnantha]|nr:hypothetical protein K1719_033104 [Acacia pycnantha]
MASDAHGSRRKHRRSSSPEEVERSSKRHKHRHGHRHHRHRHGSRKREEELELDTETVDKVPSPTPAPNFDPKIPRPDDDVEEGEILEEDGFGGRDGEIRKKHTESDAESGEILATGGRGIRSDNSNPAHFTEEILHQKDAIPSKETVGINGKGSETNNENISNGRFISPGSDGEDDTCHQRHTGYRRNEVDGSSTHSSAESLDGKRARTSSDGLGNGHLDRKFSKEDKWQHGELGCSKENEKLKGDYDNEVNEGKVRIHRKNSSPESEGGKYRTRDNSPSYRCRSRSRSSGHTHHVVEEYSHPRRRNGEERIGEYGRERGHVSTDLMAGDRREHWDRGWSKDRDLRRGKERERSWNREDDRVHRREKERERSHEKDRRDVEKDRSRGREVDRDRRREKERDRDRSWETVAERGRSDRGRERSRDRARVGERDRVWGSERDEKHRERDKIRERERHKDRNTLDKDKNLGYEHGNDSRYRDMRSSHSRLEDSESHWERKRNSESVKVDNHMDRGEVEQDDLDETATLQFAEQEEEDLNRIKEESRRRREAILEKYKKLQPQQHQQAERTSENKEKDKDPVNIPAAVSEAPDAKNDGSDVFEAEPSFTVGKSPQENGSDASEKIPGVARRLGEGTPKSERSDDEFCDDIFGETPTRVHRMGKGDGLRVDRGGLHDNWDDAEGYYSYRFGEILDARYEVIAAHGRGVFSTVVRAKNLKAGNGEPEEVAIKIIRNNDTMYKAGMDELVILKKLKFGRNIGLNLKGVQSYAKQLFIALKHLRNCGVLHCDIKPDNMLVNEAKNVLKLCDFGNAMFAGKNEVTPYLVSRFYRAPEIILGLQYDHPLDIWSVGCCLYELYTGKVLFPGHTNNDMLRLHMELKGPFPKKMLRKGAFVDQHFDQDLNFLATEEDPVTKKAIKRLILNIKPKDIGTIIAGSPGEEADRKKLANFKDLLDKIFVLDPEKRLTVSQALGHPFITGK